MLGLRQNSEDVSVLIFPSFGSPSFFPPLIKLQLGQQNAEGLIPPKVRPKLCSATSTTTSTTTAFFFFNWTHFMMTLTNVRVCLVPKKTMISFYFCSKRKLNYVPTTTHAAALSCYSCAKIVDWNVQRTRDTIKSAEEVRLLQKNMKVCDKKYCYLFEKFLNNEIIQNWCGT